MQNLHVHQKSHIACFGKKVKNYHQHCFAAHIFKKKSLFELFELLDAQKIGFGAWGRFSISFYVQEFIDLFTVFAIFYKFWKMLHNSFSYEPSRQYGISPFSKTILNKSK